MEDALHLVMNLVALTLAMIAILAAVTVGLGNVKSLRHPLARLVVTPVLAVLGLWILFEGIQHTFSS